MSLFLIYQSVLYMVEVSSLISVEKIIYLFDSLSSGTVILISVEVAVLFDLSTYMSIVCWVGLSPLSVSA